MKTRKAVPERSVTAATKRGDDVMTVRNPAPVAGSIISFSGQATFNGPQYPRNGASWQKLAGAQIKL